MKKHRSESLLEMREWIEKDGLKLLHKIQKEIILADLNGDTDKSLIERLMINQSVLNRARRSAFLDLYSSFCRPNEQFESREYKGSLSESEVVNLMKNIGVFMTEKRWDFDKRTPTSSEIVSLFFTWDRAWRLAGITIPKNHKFSDDDLLQALKDRGEFAPKFVWDSERRSPGSRVIITRFGSWQSAWERAGFTVPSDSEIEELRLSRRRKTKSNHAF